MANTEPHTHTNTYKSVHESKLRCLTIPGQRMSIKRFMNINKPHKFTNEQKKWGTEKNRWNVIMMFFFLLLSLVDISHVAIVAVQMLLTWMVFDRCCRRYATNHTTFPPFHFYLFLPLCGNFDAFFIDLLRGLVIFTVMWFARNLSSLKNGTTTFNGKVAC